VFGLLGAVIGLGFAVLKLALFVALPCAVVGWLVMRLIGGGKSAAGQKRYGQGVQSTE
jgi:hypothetical protein